MNKQADIWAIVEGEGEEQAIPDLVRRILRQRGCCNVSVDNVQVQVAGGKPNLLKKFEVFLEWATIEGCTAILVLLDADEECPRENAVCLSQRAAAKELSVPVAIVYAESEYENWFICSLASSEKGTAIRKHLDLPEHVVAPDNAETIQDAKEWLEEFMPRDRAYKPTVDQAPLTRLIDLDLVWETSRSFRRMCHAVEELVNAVDQGMTIVTPRID